MSFPRAVRRLLKLPNADRRLLLRAFVWLGFIQVALRIAGFQRVVQHAEPALSSSAPDISAESLLRAENYARRLETASRYQRPRPQCLPRAMVLHYWLRGEGLPSELRVGVYKDGEALRAHAWVELYDRVLGDAPAAVAHFTPLATPRNERLARAVTLGPEGRAAC